jgi:hypothetical protein
MIVDFILIGAQKSGTTSLSHQLAQHPQISFCRHKEPNFFSKSPDWAAILADYHALYEQAPGKLYGEGSTTYTWLLEYPETAKRLYAYNPNLKLIYLMRQPVERIVSHYTHHLLRARTRYPQDEELFAVPTYINHSRYALQIRPYLELFPRENILLLLFEEYVADPLATLAQIGRHIGARPEGFADIDLSPQYQSLDRTGDRKIKKWLTPLSRLFPLKVRNALRGPFVYKLDAKVQFSSETRRLLWRYVEDDVRALETIMGRSLEIWRQPPYDC